MVEQAALGLERLRVSIDSLPAPLPAFASALPKLLVVPLFALRIPNLIVPYADAAAVILAHVQRQDTASRHRVGLALPAGMKGSKSQWAAGARAVD